MKLISIVTPCFNEELNVALLYNKLIEIFEKNIEYRFEIIFIDNASTDNTVSVLKSLAKNDKRVKVIVNSRNFGWLRSPYYGLIQSYGDATIYMASDLQDPPELISEFIRKWEEGYKIAIGVKSKSEESKLVFAFRKFFYNMVRNFSDSGIDFVKNYTGFGLYDKRIIDILRNLKDANPLIRSIISEIGFEKAIIEFKQPLRKKGRTKRSFYKMLDVALLGITSNSKVPIRMATIIGFFMGTLSLLISLVYLILKIILWKEYPLGFASLIIGIFFFASIQLFFIGIIGEYIGAIYTQVLNRPLVIEKERINFEDLK